MKATERLKEIDKWFDVMKITLDNAKDNLDNDEDFTLLGVMVLHHLVSGVEPEAAEQYKTFIQTAKGCMIADELEQETKK